VIGTEATRTSWGVGPAEERAVVRVHGADARDYLHRMSTQDLLALSPGRSALTTFLDAKGHLLGDAQVLVREEDVLLEIDPAAAPGAMAQLERLVIADDVAFEDLSARVRVLPLLEPRGRPPRPEVEGVLAVLESRRRGVPALDLVVNAGRAAEARRALLDAGAVEVSAGELEVLRILGGRPRWGLDLDGSRLPMEAGLTCEAISFTKGCYVGQEVVVRATSRGRLQKGLVVLDLPGVAGPGAKLLAAGQEVGWVTSAADAPDGRVGLGYLRRAHWRAGERLETAGGEAVVRRVVVEEPEA